MPQGDTVERILHAATVLFAERGFAETSLRTITGMADVNLAAVNYHFGSKKELIQAVFARFLTPFCRELEQSLDKIESELSEGEAPDIQELLRCLFGNLLAATEEVNEPLQRFMRLLGMAYSQSQDHLRHYLSKNYGDSYHRLSSLLERSSPGLTPVEFYWRLYFMLGAAIFTLSSYDSIRAILNADYKEDTELSEAIKIMSASLGGLFRVGDASSHSQ